MVAMFISFAVSAPAFAFTIKVTNLTGTGSGTVNLLSNGGSTILDSCTPVPGSATGCTFSQAALTGNVLQAVPDSTSIFDGWTNHGTPGGGCPATGTCNVIISGNWTVDAKFDTIPGLCTYAISPTSQSYSSAGGSNSISVSYTPGACTVGSWTAASNVPWITVTSGNTGAGNGEVNYSVAANTGAVNRTGAINVAGQSFNVTQSANSSRLITLSADSLNFGTVSAAPPSSAKLTISNAGSSPLSVNSVIISGTNAGDFSALDECSTIPAGDSCPVTVLFSPSATGGAENATLTVNSTDTVFPAYNVALSGTASGTAAANILLDTTSINYKSADIEFGNISPITVTNTGTGSLVISSVDIEGRDAAEFAINNTCPVIAAGANCTLNLTSSYTSSAAKQASLVISSNAAGTPKVEVPISAGMLSCDISTISLSATSQSVDYGGANGTITVNASSSCWWQPLSNDPWITITSGNGGTTGNGTVGYSLSANTNNANIFGNMTVAGKHFSVVQYGSAGNSIFNDNTDTAVSDYINALAARGITTGCGNNDFCPYDSVTREEMAAFIVRALEGEPPATYCSAGSPFSDVASDSTWCKYVKRLYELGITIGCGSGNFCPDTAVSRDQMAAFLIRAFYGEDFTCTGGVAGAAVACATTTPYFNDVPSVTADQFFPYIQKLYELGITVGCGNNNYCPAESVSREYMAVFLDRAFLGMQ